MSEKIITELVLEGEKEAIASIQRVGNAADATFADLKNVQLDFDFIEPKKGLKLLTDAGQRFARQPRLKPCGCDPITIRSGSIATRSSAGAGHVHPRSMRELELTPNREPLHQWKARDLIRGSMIIGSFSPKSCP